MAGEMLDRVARAIWHTNKPKEAPGYADLDALDQGRVQMIARAAIEELFEPTKDMVEAYEKLASPCLFSKEAYVTMLKVGMGDLHWEEEKKNG